MKKLNLLKGIVDLIWILSIILIPLLLFFIIGLFFIDKFDDFTFKINGDTLQIVDFKSKLLIAVSASSYFFVLYAIYLFKKSLAHFKRAAIFDDLVIANFKKIGNLLILSTLINGFFMLIYRITYQSETSKSIKFELGLSPFLVTVLIGLFFLVLSEVFTIAKKAKQENDLTI